LTKANINDTILVPVNKSYNFKSGYENEKNQVKQGEIVNEVMGMGGIYRGIIEDATLLIDNINSDIWVVQHNTRGPFGELSRVPQNLIHRTLSIPGSRP
jgi:hypothetical protein